MDSSERRKYIRHEIKLEVTCQKIGLSGNESFSGQTVNVSTGGLLASTHESEIKIGDLLNVYLSVPPTQGLLETGGRFESFAKVTRIYHVNSSDINKKSRAVAMQFCSAPKLSV